MEGGSVDELLDVTVERRMSRSPWKFAVAVR
jgi:hypothetical protein